MQEGQRTSSYWHTLSIALSLDGVQMGRIPPTRTIGQVYRNINKLCTEIDTSGDVQVPDHFEHLSSSTKTTVIITALSGGQSTVRSSLQNAYYNCIDVMIK